MSELSNAASAIFEPEEARVLERALTLVLKRLPELDASDQIKASDVARIVHDVAAERVRFKKPIVGSSSAEAIATDALEQLSFLREAPPELVECAKAHKGKAKLFEHPGHFFPLEFRQRPERPL